MGDTTTIRDYVVTGMVCQHCVSAVSQQIGAIEGVTNVEVDLTTGRVSVTSNRALDDAMVRAAIDEAGYEIAG
ncbi:MAG: heavy-metal-associated domain-containing protein [Actinomycetota bacterium]|nr:heavy-metal-associated domain-containing protein [Actinomycetota bacterium]